MPRVCFPPSQPSPAAGPGSAVAGSFPSSAARAGREQFPAACGKEAIERRPRRRACFLPALSSRRNNFSGASGGPGPPRGSAFSLGLPPAPSGAHRRCSPKPCSEPGWGRGLPGGGRAGTAPAPTAPPELLCWLGNPAQRRPRAPDGAAGRVAALQGQQPAATGAPRAAPAPAQALPPRPGQSLVFLCWEVRRNPPRAGRGAPGSRGWDPARDGTGGVFPWEVEEINMPLPGHLLRGSIARPGGPWLQRLLARRSRRSSAALGGLGRDCGPYVNGKGSSRPGLLPAGKEQTGKGSKRERAEESKKERKEEEK